MPLKERMLHVPSPFQQALFLKIINVPIHRYIYTLALCIALLNNQKGAGGGCWRCEREEAQGTCNLKSKKGGEGEREGMNLGKDVCSSQLHMLGFSFSRDHKLCLEGFSEKVDF